VSLNASLRLSCAVCPDGQSADCSTQVDQHEQRPAHPALIKDEVEFIGLKMMNASWVGDCSLSTYVTCFAHRLLCVVFGVP